MEIIAPVVARSFKELKDYNEVLLARELYNVLAKDPEFMATLRTVVHLGVCYIIDLYEAVKDNSSEVQVGKKQVKVNEGFADSVQSEFLLKTWGATMTKKTPIAQFIDKLRPFKIAPQNLTPNNCSELLRLFGGVVENTAKVIDITLSVRPGNSQPPVQFPSLREMDMLRGAYRNVVFATYDNSKKEWNRPGSVDPFSGEVRMRWQIWVKPGGTPPVVRIDFATKKSVEDMPGKVGEKWEAGKCAAAGYKLGGLTSAQKDYVMGSMDEHEIRGMSLWELKKGSPVWAIDRIFGLPPGADISGTTADIMWALEMLANQKFPPWGPVIDTSDFTPMKGGPWSQYTKAGFGVSGGRPNCLNFLYLLPIAAMVAHYHHSILECALTQTLNGEIEYSVGYYTTLLPSSIENKSSGLGKAVYHVLEKYEKHPTNFKMIFVDDWNGVWGYIFSGEDELKAFREFATVNLDRYQKVFAPLKDLEKIGSDELMSHMASIKGKSGGFTREGVSDFCAAVEEGWDARQKFYDAMR